MCDVDALPLPTDVGQHFMIGHDLKDVAATALPEPYGSLLVHHRDMTGTLEAFHGTSLKLRVLDSKRSGQVYQRRVLLVTCDDQTIVEYGGICIYLNAFSENAKQLILAGQQPLGGILNSCEIPFTSAPDRFIAINADAELCQLLGMSQTAILYGRTNVLRRPDGVALAEIVEILPAIQAS